MMKYLISACLCGVDCKYNKTNNLNPTIKKIYLNGEAILVCPEVMGGLSIPREACEIVNGKAISVSGKDCTNEYQKGAEIVLKLALENNIKRAILKDKSPSCGCNYIYDGTFTKNLIKGKGIAAKLLEENGIEVISDTIY